MNHFATPGFWYHYRNLPDEVQELRIRTSHYSDETRITHRCG